MPTWYRALSAPAANRPAHGTPQQAPGGGTAAHASSRHPSSPGSMRTPHSQHTSPRAGIRTPTPRGGERVARDSVFGRSGSKVRTTRFPLPPKTAQASRRTPQNCKFFFPVLANLELHDACPPRNLIHQFPHRSKTAFLASASFPVRNISAPFVPQTPPQPTARRPVHGRIQPTTRTRRAPAGARESARYARAPSPARYALSSASRAPRASSS